MKNGKAPTKREKIAMKAAGLTPEKWLIYKKTHETLEVVHRETGTTKTILA
ncbi:hypothetical protein V7114_20750 [Neobacillus niacini]|uniref:DUF6906 family protein n=1 Tax=Neobacillus niacini TaxID=86668 RepID=UPI003000822C